MFGWVKVDFLHNIRDLLPSNDHQQTTLMVTVGHQFYYCVERRDFKMFRERTKDESRIWRCWRWSSEFISGKQSKNLKHNVAGHAVIGDEEEEESHQHGFKDFGVHLLQESRCLAKARCCLDGKLHPLCN